MTAKPIVADNKPQQITLKKDSLYYYCQCGRSAKQPFCDGSHKGTLFTPLHFTASSDETAYLCNCKHSANKPFCDGTHKKFTAAQIGKAEQE